jgi:starvation-inducible DNA-binding protein
VSTPLLGAHPRRLFFARRPDRSTANKRPDSGRRPKCVSFFFRSSKMADDKYRVKEKAVDAADNGKPVPSPTIKLTPQPNRDTPARLHATRNDLPGSSRSNLVALLNGRLADCLDLQMQTKQAHWNVKGPDFIALHKLFDEIHEDIEDYSDTIAERAVQLGGIAVGTPRFVASQSSLAEYPPTISAGHDHVIALADALAAFGLLARQAIDDANEFGDAITADVFTQVTRGIDKWLWMVEAHLPEPERSGSSIVDGRSTGSSNSSAVNGPQARNSDTKVK